MALKIKFICIMAIFSISFCLASSYGQQEMKKRDFINIFIEKIDGWDARQYKFVKKNLETTFQKRLEYRAERRLYGYENAAWIEKGKKLWTQLPDILEPKLTLSRISRNVLYAIFYINLPTYMEYINSLRLDINKDLDIPFFAILGVAQPLALKHGKEKIFAPYIGVALEKYEESYHWPECLPPKPFPGK